MTDHEPTPSAQPASDAQSIVVITGMAGSGRNFALKTLEDMGYDAVDNLPLSLMPLFVTTHMALHKPVAIGVDARSHDFSSTYLLQQLEQLKCKPGVRVRLLFCDCDDEVLARRFTETRRRHPLAHERPVIDGIRSERSLMAIVRERADFILDTTSLSVVDCRQILRQNFALPWAGQLTFHVMSFAFRHGLPREADVVLDVRFLKNPHYSTALAPQTGLDAPVQAFLQQDPALEPFMKNLRDTLTLVLPRFDDDGRSYLTIAFGCTGGQHRSVYCAHVLGAWLKSQGRIVVVRHRELRLL